MNKSHFEHSAFALLALIPGLWLGWWEMFALASGFLLGREHAQAEYRYLSKHKLNRQQVKWLEFKCLRRDYWDLDSVLDFLAPVVAMLVAISIVLVNQ